METSKIKKDKSKTTYLFLFRLKFVKMKKFCNFGPETAELIRKYFSSIQIFEKVINKVSFA